MTNDITPARPIQIRGCRKCGASIRVEEGTWECPHCGEFYEEPEFEVTAEPGMLSITLEMPGADTNGPEQTE